VVDTCYDSCCRRRVWLHAVRRRLCGCRKCKHAGKTVGALPAIVEVAIILRCSAMTCTVC
jgi:hypothetical protein